MYQIINFLAFLGCVFWLYIDPSPEPTVVLLMSTAAFFRDDIHGLIGRNLFSLTPKNRLIRDLNSSKFSFTGREFINPRIIEDLVGWLSDSGDQVISINITTSNNSNRYHGSITHTANDSEYPIVKSEHSEGYFSYKYLGCSFSGVHIIQTWSNTGGLGVFCNVVLVTLSQDASFQDSIERASKVDRFVIKLVGTLTLGDRYVGKPTYNFGLLTIPSCEGSGSLRTVRSTTLVL